MIPNLFKLFKDFQKIQGEMEKIQGELEGEEVTGSSGAGMVEVTLNGKLEAIDVRVEESILKNKNLQMLQDLLVAAINDAIKKAQAKMKERMGEIAGGLDLSGLNIPGISDNT